MDDSVMEQNDQRRVSKRDLNWVKVEQTLMNMRYENCDAIENIIVKY